MKTNGLLLFGLVLAAVVVSSAAAQELAGPLMYQPMSVQQPMVDDPLNFAMAEPAARKSSPSPSDRPPPPPPEVDEAPSLPAAPGGAAAGLPCPPPCVPCCPDPPKPWHMPQPCGFKAMGIDMGGWLQQGITINPQQPADNFNGPVFTNDRAGEYMLNQFWVYFVRPTKTDGCGIDIGGRIDVVYGEDWRYGQCYGLEDRIDGANNFYGLILPQFYFEVAINDLTVKMGHFATFTSYEVVPAPLNFFYSHTYLMGAYFDPLLVTGMQADYKLNDNWTLVAGFNRGWMMYEDLNHDLDYLGGVKWASDDKRSTLSVMVETGAQDPAGDNVRTSVFTVFTHQLTKRLLYATQWTVGHEPNAGYTPPASNDTWYGMNQYLFYKINPKWSAGVRFEWVRDEHGARVFGIGNILGTDRGWDGLPGFAGNFTDLSFGLNWRPHPNFVFRPEIRWDWYDGTRNVANELPFDNGTKSHQFLLATDLIVTF